MASSSMVVFENAPDQGTPLVATVNPVTGEMVITHANAVDPVTGAPVFDPTIRFGHDGKLIVETTMSSNGLLSLFEGQIFGIDKKLIAVGLLAYFFLKK